jgi:hypothetical protein
MGAMRGGSAAAADFAAEGAAKPAAEKMRRARVILIYDLKTHFL